jgi:hypothetical protein
VGDLEKLLGVYQKTNGVSKRNFFQDLKSRHGAVNQWKFATHPCSCLCFNLNVFLLAYNINMYLLIFSFTLYNHNQIFLLMYWLIQPVCWLIYLSLLFGTRHFIQGWGCSRAPESFRVLWPWLSQFLPRLPWLLDGSCY